MPEQGQTPLLLELKPSKRLETMLCLLHACAVLAVLANTLPVPLKLLLLAALGINLALMLKRNRAEHRKIKFTPAWGFELSKESGFLAVEVLNSSVITPHALFLHLKTQDNKRQTVLVLSDSLCEDSYRSLIVKLKTVKQNE